MSTTILEGYSSEEKTAYITAIASIATADQSASEEEVNYLVDLADTADLGEEGKQLVVHAAKDTTGEPLQDALEVLKSSDLRFSLVTDLMAFAEADQNISEQEKNHITSIAGYLNINADQLEALNDYVKQTTAQPAALGISGQNTSQEGGLEGILKNSGINIGSLTKGLIAIAGPIILSKMMGRGSGGLRGARGLNQGGLGSLIGGLSGGRGLSGLGGLLGRFIR